MLLRTGKGTCSAACRTAKETLSKAWRRHYGIAAPLTDPLEEIQVKSHGVKGFDSVKVSTLDNGIKVASMETHVPLARLSIYAKAGSRYETADNIGITHQLRNGALLSAKDRSALHIVRETAQNGASLEVTTTREHLIYSASCLNDKVPSMIENIAATIKEPMFFPWELRDAANLTELDKAVLEQTIQAGTIELLHEAAYRYGLGNSLYCPDDRLASFSPQQMQEFQKAHLVGTRMGVFALGMDHSLLVEHVQKTLGGLPKGDADETPKQVYHGGEARRRTGSGLTHVAVAAEGAGLLDKDFVTLGVLQRILGVTPFIKWGSHTVSSRINRAVLDVTNSAFMASALNIGYADSGLFGFYAVVDPKHSHQVLKAIVGQFGSIAKGNVTDEELTRAKNQLKAAVLMSSESHDAIFEDMAIQTMTKGSYTSPVESISDIDNVTMEDVVAVSKRLFAGKPSIAGCGDTPSMPYLDELF